jgi:polysaccharide biosynthesis protein PslH
VKLLIVSSRFPYPITKGDKLRLFHQIKELSISYDIVLVCLSDEYIEPYWKKQIQSYCTKLEIFHLSAWNAAYRLVSGMSRLLPAQVAYFFDRGIQRKIKALIDQEKPDYLFVPLIRAAEYTRGEPIPKGLDYMDCFSINSKKRARAASYFWTKWFWNWEAKMVRRYEANIYPSFDDHFIISRHEQSLLPIGLTCTEVGNGIDSDYFLQDIDNHRDIDLLFTGNLSYYSNQAAIDLLLTKILPAVLTQDAPIKMVIAGASPTTALTTELAKWPQIEFYRDVPEIRVYYQRAKLFVAPIFQGTGQQNKILEAIAGGCLVLTTPEVAKSFGPDFRSVTTESDVDRYADQIRNLLEHFDQTQADRLADQTMLKEEYSWKNKLQGLVSTVGATLQKMG